MEGRCEQEVIAAPSNRKKLWRHSFFCIIAAALLMSAALAAWGAGHLLRSRARRRNLPPPPDVSRIEPLLKHGDIILRSGIGLWSDFFRSRNLRDKRFSHVGIVQRAADGSWQVIHADGDDFTGHGTVFADTLANFVGQSTAVGIGRLRVADPESFVRNARKCLGRPFDWKFDTEESTAIYCTELVDLALRETDPRLRLPAERGIILPEACLVSGFFAEIPVP